MLSKIFKKLPNQLKVQDQFIILLVFSTMIPVSIVGLYGIYASNNSLLEVAKNNMETESNKEANKINDFLDGVSNNVFFLSKTPPIQGIIRARDNGGLDGETNLSYNAWVGQLQANFVAMMEQNPHYMKLRYIDENGKELVRVDVDGSKSKIVPEGELQQQRDREFFTETMKLSPKKLYVSPVDLNQENGEIKKPYQATIRYSIPILNSSGQKKGIIVANVFADKFIKAFKEGNNQRENTENIYPDQEKFIVNQDGFYISHPNAAKEWGFEFKKNDKLDQDYSPNVAKKILSSEKGFVEQGDYLFAFRRVDPSPNQPEFLVVINRIPKNSVFATVHSLKIVTILIILISLAVVLSLAIFRTRQVVHLIKQLVNVISASIQQTFSGLDQQARIAGQQAASVHETTTTMDELEASCRQSAQQAKSATTAAQQALTTAEDGSQAVKETLESMFILEKKVVAIADQIVHLSAQASQIASISQIVSDLANQTNMLALNSSVEAVRAGEYGKGFAVVANEIRRLSDQSQKSADKINILVSSIQKAINSTVMVTEEGTKIVKTGVENVQKSDQAFAGVAGAINYMVVNNQQISLNLKQQLDAIQQVVQAMDNINRGAKETATGINQTKLGTEQLSAVALTLKEIV
ncbi:MAG: methyl-accepting chemotaxis protein [Pelatocladus maniniholoensis HA4357-MV3]|jgi:methyl-accepting chemotaxis protein|uniref:Methyl-accepting chemotaxis protein n=1 Tax=Pelatocladus maniniholoensis HA4357-MV3 TaxID=1117104 RepID=A0A9E3H5Z1_9NOST|nr:methyl-accepting chemotaxis protein [Pelatocladus maniniholoensis HA4357-MV3]